MIDTTFIDIDIARLAVHEVSPSDGPAIVFLHGNSCSHRAFARQLDGALAREHRLVAIDLAGHGDSGPARDPDKAYGIVGHASAVVAVAAKLRLESAVFVGWSLGGHVLLEAASALDRAAGFLIFGAPPLGSAADMARAFLPNPNMAAAFRADSTDAEVEALLASFFAPPSVVPDVFREDFRRTDPRARAAVGAAAATGAFTNEVDIVAKTTKPLAVLHGAAETIANRAYIEALRMPTLWRGAVQEIAGAGHAAQWDEPDAFNELLAAFARDCAPRG